MLQRKEEELVKRQTIEKRALPKRIRAERKARDMMFRESLRISIHHDPKAEEDKIKKVSCATSSLTRRSFNSFPSQTVPRAREEAIHARAAAFWDETHEAAWGVASQLWFNR